MVNWASHNELEIREELRRYAQEISQRFGGAPVVISLAGSRSAGVPATVTGAANLGEGREGRMRDELGILQAAVQIEALEHLLDSRLRPRDEAIAKIATAIQKIAEETGTSVDL